MAETAGNVTWTAGRGPGPAPAQDRRGAGSARAERGGMQRAGAGLTAAAMALTCALLVWAPIPLGSNRPWAWSLLAAWAAVLLLAWGLGQLLGGAGRPGAPEAYRPSAS